MSLSSCCCGALQDPKELAKWRRKQSNREAARRSRARKAEQAEGLQQQLAEREVEFQQLKAEKDALRQRFVALHAQAERLSSEREALKQQVRTLICLYHQGCQQ